MDGPNAAAKNSLQCCCCIVVISWYYVATVVCRSWRYIIFSLIAHNAFIRLFRL